MPRKTKGDGDSAAQKRGPPSMTDTVRDKKKSSTPIASDRLTPITSEGNTYMWVYVQ